MTNNQIMCYYVFNRDQLLEYALNADSTDENFNLLFLILCHEDMSNNAPGARDNCLFGLNHDFFVNALNSCRYDAEITSTTLSLVTTMYEQICRFVGNA